MSLNQWRYVVPLTVALLVGSCYFLDRSIKVNGVNAEKLAIAHYSRERSSFRAPDPRTWDIAVNVGYRAHVLDHGQVETFKIEHHYGGKLSSHIYVVSRVTRAGKPWEETLEFYQKRCIGFQASRVDASGNAESKPSVSAQPDDKLDPKIYSPVVTSTNEKGLFVLSQYFPSSDSWGVEDRLHLASGSKGEFVRHLDLGVRLDRDLEDLIYVSGNHIVVLICRAASSYTHHFIRKEKGKFALEMGRVDSGHFGSRRSLVLGESIIGIVFRSPNVSKDYGQFLYVFGPSGLEFAKLPEIEGQYDIAKLSESKFKLIRYPNGKKPWSTIYDLPLSMRDGTLID